MTSNAGAERIVAPRMLGFSSQNDEKSDYEHMKNGVMDEVRRLFKPEFLNRIDEIIVFKQLNKENMKNILDIMMARINAQTKQQMNITLELDEKAEEMLIDEGYDPKYGARPLKRVLQSRIEDRLAEEVLAGNISNDMTVHISCKEEEGTEGKKELTFTAEHA